LREEGLAVRKVVRIFAPLEAGDHHEVLWVDKQGRAATTYHGPDGKLLFGPVLGFGG
jgi:hypothetical protein